MSTLTHFFRAAQTIILFRISPFVENPASAALTKPLSFKELCLDAGLPPFCMNLIETSTMAMRLNQPQGR